MLYSVISYLCGTKAKNMTTTNITTTIRYKVEDLTWAKCKSFQVVDTTDNEVIAEFNIYNFNGKENAKRLADQKAKMANDNN